MSLTRHQPLRRAAQIVRTAALLVVAGVWRSRSLDQIERRVADQPLRVQAGIVGGVLAALLILAFFFAQAGWVGILIYWLILIVLVR